MDEVIRKLRSLLEEKINIPGETIVISLDSFRIKDYQAFKTASNSFVEEYITVELGLRVYSRD